MSSPPRAEGYDCTPAQQREDTTTFMLAKVSYDLTSACRARPDCALARSRRHYQLRPLARSPAGRLAVERRRHRRDG